MTNIPRGIRNSNPFNIVKSNNDWVGKVEGGPDERFETFKDAVYGIRAGIKLLINYKKQGFDTVEKIIGKFAPPFENNTKEYISHVSKKLGVLPTEIVELTDDVLHDFAVAIITMENGCTPYSDTVILNAIKMAK